MAKTYPESNITEEEFFHRLHSFPCLFTDLKHADTISPERLETLKKKLQGKQLSTRNSKATTIPSSSDRDNGGSNVDSVLVYIFWKLKQEEEAKRMAKEAVSMYPESILVSTNMAYILRKLGEFSDAEKHLLVLEEMKQNSAAEFRDLVTEAHLGVAFFYYLYRHSKFGLHAIEIYEKILEKQPDNGRCKLYLARVLKKRQGEVTMEVGSQSPLARAIDLLASIKNKVENNAQLRAEAAAELGGILYSSCPNDVVKEKSAQLGLEPDQCYSQALQLAEDNARVLLNSGKYFGRTGREEKALTLFERLVELQPDNAKAHLFLGQTLNTTFRKKQQNQQEDDIAKRALKCLQKAQVLGDDSIVLLLELGNVQSSLRKYDDALCYYLQVVTRQDNQFFTGKALSKAAHVLFKVRKEWKKPEYQNLTSLAKSLLKMAAIFQIRRMLEAKHRAEYWSCICPSLFVLGTILQDKDRSSETTVQDLPSGEKWLLGFLRRQSAFPSLQSILPMSESDAEDPDFLQSRLRGLHDAGHHEDAALYIALLRLTSMGHVMAASEARQLQFKVHVEAAQTMLRLSLGREDIYNKLKMAAAALLFRWAFEDRYYNAEQCLSQERADRCDVEPDPGDTDPDLYDYDTDPTDNKTHVLIVHGSSDQNDAASLQQILREVCGLQITCFSDSGSTLDGSVALAWVVLFLAGEGSSTQEFHDLAAQAVAIVTRSDTAAVNDTPQSSPSPEIVLSVVKGNADIPAALQGHPSLTWIPELAEHNPDMSLSEGQIKAVVRLFSFFIGLTE